jgi:hypothetical protein
LQYTYINTTSSSTTPAQQINTDGRAIVVRKIIVGNPVSTGNITIHNNNVALSNDTTTINFKNTFPTFSTSALAQFPTVIDFRAGAMAGGGSAEADGLECSQGGSLVIDQTMQLTVLWDYAQGN